MPPSIDTQQSLVAPVEGFEPLVDTLNGAQTLESVVIYDGHPQEGASLVPDNVHDKKDPYWTRHPGTESFWMGCFYRQSTVRLIRELPKTAKKCTLKFKKSAPVVKPSQERPDVLICE